MQKFALVLTCSPVNPIMSDQWLENLGISELVQHSDQHSDQHSETRWLGDGVSSETLICCEPSVVSDLLNEVRQRIGGAPVDANIVAQDGFRRKRLLIADMDSTIIAQECIDELAELAGAGAYVRAITERAMRGELAFEDALRQRVSALRGLTEQQLQNVLDTHITLTPGAKTLVGTMRAHGAHCALVSGGFTWFTRAISERVGFCDNQANELVICNGIVTGRVGEPILGREAKLEALLTYLKALRLPADASIAVGDGANDLAMIRHAGLGVAFRAKPVVGEQAAASVVHGDLTALLFLQGYTQKEFQANAP